MLPQFGFIVAQAGADSQQPPYYARPYMPHNIYYDNRFYRPPLPPISQPTEWHPFPLWQPPPPPPPQVQKPVEKFIETRSQVKDMPDTSQHNIILDEASELSEDEEFVCETQEYNDLMQQMDNEFWEQCDDVFKNRLVSLKDELEAIQHGTHAAFEETMADIEIKKEQTIEYAEQFKTYELLFAHNQYDMEISLIKEEYAMDTKLFHDTMLHTIEERKKQLKENKNDLGAKDLLETVEKKMSQTKKTLRKKTHPYEHQPIRLERRRQNRSKAQYDIHASPSHQEDDDLEAEFLQMKEISFKKIKYKA